VDKKQGICRRQSRQLTIDDSASETRTSAHIARDTGSFAASINQQLLPVDELSGASIKDIILLSAWPVAFNNEETLI